MNFYNFSSHNLLAWQVHTESMLIMLSFNLKIYAGTAVSSKDLQGDIGNRWTDLLAVAGDKPFRNL